MPPFQHRNGVDAAKSVSSSAAGSSAHRTHPLASSAKATTKSVPSFDAGSPTFRKYPPVRSAKATPHKGPRSVASSSTEQSKEELVGPVTETTRDHKKRHHPFNDDCPRCHWIKMGEKWSQTCGKVPEGRRTPMTGEYWCVPRQPRRGGHWALGCTVCALVNESNALSKKTPSQTPATSKKQKRTFREFDTKWARYEVRTKPQSSLLHQHARQDQHTRALTYLNRQASNEDAAEDTPSECE